MRVLINRLTAIRQKTGIGHYIDQLLRALPSLACDDDIIVYPGAVAERGMHAWKCWRRWLGSKATSRAGASRACASRACASRARASMHSVGRSFAAWHFRLFGASRAFDLYHEPNYIPLPCDRPTVATVHDLSVLLRPEWHPADRVAYYERYFHRAVQQCRHLLAVSEFTRQELIQHLHVPAEKVTCTYNGVRPEMRPLFPVEYLPVLHRLNLPESYLLYVGTLEPRKNLLLLLRAYCALPEEVRRRCPLVLVGGWGWSVAKLADFFHREARHRGVVHLGYVADADLVALYNGARALVFPTLYEGFGFPAVEMLACGGAVLASTAGALVEIAGKNACLLDPHDQDAWTRTMHLAIDDDDWRDVQRRGALAAARPFTWERCAAQTWQVYRAALQGQQGLARAA